MSEVEDPRSDWRYFSASHAAITLMSSAGYIPETSLVKREGFTAAGQGPGRAPDHGGLKGGGPAVTEADPGDCAEKQRTFFLLMMASTIPVPGS